MATKTINILGEDQRAQWHTVVNMLRQLGGMLDKEGRSALCDDLDRYIDGMEDAVEQLSAKIEKLEKEAQKNSTKRV